tara:strand:+ start:1522 stop:1683 length:162 start_codon:yes stop_codon:yes gene_type:complete
MMAYRDDVYRIYGPKYAFSSFSSNMDEIPSAQIIFKIAKKVSSKGHSTKEIVV